MRSPGRRQRSAAWRLTDTRHRDDSAGAARIIVSTARYRVDPAKPGRARLTLRPEFALDANAKRLRSVASTSGGLRFHGARGLNSKRSLSIKIIAYGSWPGPLGLPYIESTPVSPPTLARFEVI